MEYILKKVKFSESKFGKALSGKGFYIALCLSLVAVGIAGIVAYNQTVKKLSEPPAVTAPQTSSDPSAKLPGFTDAGKQKTDIPMATEEPTSIEPMVMPVSGEVITPFSNGELVKSATTKIWQTHNGADIGAKVGTQVKAIAGGKVTDVGNDTRWGNYVVIDHKNGVQSKYCNLSSSVPVKTGDTVSTGTVIGSVDESAQIEISDPSHLHIEVIQNGKYIDPISFIDPNGK